MTKQILNDYCKTKLHGHLLIFDVYVKYPWVLFLLHIKVLAIPLICLCDTTQTGLYIWLQIPYCVHLYLSQTMLCSSFQYCTVHKVLELLQVQVVTHKIFFCVSSLVCLLPARSSSARNKEVGLSLHGRLETVQ